MVASRRGMASRRARAKGEELRGALFGKRGVPRRESAFNRIGTALGWRGEEALFGSEKMDREIGERALGKVGKGGGELARLWVGGNRAEELDVGGEAVGGEEDAVRLPGWGESR